MTRDSTQELLLKRLRYRSGHRGCKETDIVFIKFSEVMLDKLDAAGLEAYARLLDEDDADIWGWLTGRETPAEAAYLPLIELLKGCGQP